MCLFADTNCAGTTDTPYASFTDCITDCTALGEDIDADGEVDNFEEVALSKINCAISNAREGICDRIDVTMGGSDPCTM